MSSAYYTDDEMLLAIQTLLDAGRPINDICADPRCQPDIRAKLERLKQLGCMPQVLTPKTNLNGTL